MSRELPFLLQKFLQDTGWPAPGNRSVALRMQTALQFFHKRLPRWISLSLDEIVEDRYPARLQDLPPGDCEVKVLVLDPARPEGDRILGKPKVLGRVSIEPAKK